MTTMVGSRLTALGALIALPLATGHANATPLAQVNAFIGSSSSGTAGTTPVDTGAVGPDASNFARAVANPQAGTVGVGVATDLLGGTVSSLQAHAQASLQENWTASDPNSQAYVDCASIDCSATVQIGLHGTLSSDFANPNSPSFGGITEEIDLSGFRLQMSNSIDPVTLTPDFTGFYSFGAAKTFFSLAPATALADGSFVVDGTLNVAMSLFSSFQSNTSLTADWSGEGFIAAPLGADLLDTATFNIVSSNPNVVWTSDSGRTSTLASPPPTSVPEPGTMALMGVGLAGAAVLRRRRSG